MPNKYYMGTAGKVADRGLRIYETIAQNRLSNKKLVEQKRSSEASEGIARDNLAVNKDRLKVSQGTLALAEEAALRKRQQDDLVNLPRKKIAEKEMLQNLEVKGLMWKKDGFDVTEVLKKTAAGLYEFDRQNDFSVGQSYKNFDMHSDKVIQPLLNKTHENLVRLKSKKEPTEKDLLAIKHGEDFQRLLLDKESLLATFYPVAHSHYKQQQAEAQASLSPSQQLSQLKVNALAKLEQGGELTRAEQIVLNQEKNKYFSQTFSAVASNVNNFGKTTEELIQITQQTLEATDLVNKPTARQTTKAPATQPRIGYSKDDYLNNMIAGPKSN